MWKSFGPGVALCVSLSRVCFVLVVFAADTRAARAASGTKDSQRQYGVDAREAFKHVETSTTRPPSRRGHASSSFEYRHAAASAPLVEQSQRVKELGALFEVNSTRDTKPRQQSQKPLVHPPSGRETTSSRETHTAVKESLAGSGGRASVLNRAAQLRNLYERGRDDQGDRNASSKRIDGGGKVGGLRPGPPVTKDVGKSSVLEKSPRGRGDSTRNADDEGLRNNARQAGAGSGLRKKVQFFDRPMVPAAQSKSGYGMPAANSMTPSHFQFAASKSSFEERSRQTPAQSTSRDGMKAVKCTTPPHFQFAATKSSFEERGRQTPATALESTSLVSSRLVQFQCPQGDGGEDEEPVYDTVPDDLNQAVTVAYHTASASEGLRTSQGLRNARRLRSLCHRFRTTTSPMLRGRSAGWSVCAFLQVFSFSYLPFSIPLIVTGVHWQNRLMALVGTIMLSGGFLLHLLTLLVLCCRRRQLTDIVPFTWGNCDVLCVGPSRFSLSLFLTMTYYADVLLIAVQRSRSEGLLPSVAAAAGTSVFLLYWTMIFGCFPRLRRRIRSTCIGADPELAIDQAVDDELGVGDVEYPDIADPASRCLSLSSVIQYMRLGFYSSFVTAIGSSLAIAACVASDRYVHTMHPIAQPPVYVDGPYYRPTPLSIIGYAGVAHTLIAIVLALPRLRRIPAACRAPSRARAPTRSRSGFYALFLYPFAFGLLTCIFGFVAAHLHSWYAHPFDFVFTVQYGVVFLGLLLALIPVLWTTIQCVGGSAQGTRQDSRAATTSGPVYEDVLEGQSDAVEAIQLGWSDSEWDDADE